MDPRAKITKQIKRVKHAYELLREAAQLMQWGIVKLDENVYVVGHKQTALYVKELIDEATGQKTTGPSQTGSLELGANNPDDSEAPHAGEPVQEERAEDN